MRRALALVLVLALGADLGADLGASAVSLDAAGIYSVSSIDGTRFAIGGTELTIALHAVGRPGRPVALQPRANLRAEGGGAQRTHAPGLVEWWRGTAEGLEHGVTISSRPEGEGDLVLELAVRGASVRALSDDAVALENEGDRIATYAHLVVLDATGARLPARMLGAGDRIALIVDDRGARYPLVVDPLLATEEAALVSSDGAPLDYLGFAIAFSADASFALASALLADTTAIDSGSARVFVRTGTTWTEQATLRAADAATDDYFGCAVALSADGSRALVGVRQDRTTAGYRAGSARVFSRVGTTWTEEATLLSPDAIAGDGLGWSVALSGDGSLALVGAPDDSTGGGSMAGTARVFVRTGTTWAHQATLVASDGRARDAFGYSVSLSTDGTRALVGVRLDDTAAGTDAGSARVFLRSGTSWNEEASLIPAGTSGDDAGRSVSLSGDGTRALVGAPGDQGVADRPGAAFVYVRAGTAWTREAMLTATGGANDDFFGWSTALSADGGRALVGAPEEAGRTGSVRAFVRAGSVWVEDVVLRAPDGMGDDYYGLSVALAPDGSRALVGASRDTTARGSLAGSVRVVTLVAPIGGACSSDAACGTGFCAGGVCCGSRCGGACEACAGALTGVADGTCGLLTGSAAPTVVCRPGSACDAPEVCTATSATCPTDVVAVTGAICRAAVSSCDVAEMCDGAAATCPADAFSPAGRACRARATGCDAVETCTGTSALCPPDVTIAPAGTACRPTVGACDVAEVCDGASTVCPGDTLLPVGVACGGTADSCATRGICDGTQASCAGSTPRPVGTVCLAAMPGVPCDVDDVCDGMSELCPSTFAAAGSVCAPPGAGACDTFDVCTGTSADCPALFLAGLECRAAAGSCDAVELCSGDAPDCPPDDVESAGMVCRASIDLSCDPAEACDGTSTSCPADVVSCAPGDAATADATAGWDAGAPSAATGCACAGAGSERSGWWIVLVLAALGVVSRRKR